ncbi:MAG: thiamine pyrophosphate-dependent enzyme [Bacteroidota bacterium]
MKAAPLLISNSSYQIPVSFWNPSDVIRDFSTCYKSRLASNAMRKEVLSGKAKFGIEGGGKELPQVALARFFQKGDYFSGYYRDQTFAMALGLATVEQLFASLYGDTKQDPYSAGRQMNNHFATPFVDEEGKWLDHTQQYNIASALSPLAGNITHALGLALASKKFREQPDMHQAALFSHQGNEVSICTVGDATTSEGVFFEALNAACVMKVPLIYVIYDDGHGISVPTKYQTTKESISDILEGFRIDDRGEGAYLYTAKGWDYEGLCRVFSEGIQQSRTTHRPAVFHIQECTQPNGHSTSGSHERYKSAERLQWEKDTDGIDAFQRWIVEEKIASHEELEELKASIRLEVKASIKQAWKLYTHPVKQAVSEVKSLYVEIIQQQQLEEEVIQHMKTLQSLFHPVLADVIKHVESSLMMLLGQQSEGIRRLGRWQERMQDSFDKTYGSELYSDSARSALKVQEIPAIYEPDAPHVNGFEVLNKNFDQLFDTYDHLYAFGEDVGKIGGVNQALAGLQAKFGENRVFDTGIREWTIVAQAIGMAMRGLRPIAEIQYLDYIHYAISPLADDLASLRYRSNGQQISPTIIRTRGHRLEGIWHSGSHLGMLIHALRGMYILVPRNMTQAAGMYNTLLQSDDPALVIECLNGYRQKEQLPANLGEFTVPLGIPEVLEEGTDLTLVTYGSCIRIAKTVLNLLKKKGISVELIDVQSLLPFDRNHRIVESLKKTNRIIFLDEDVPGGATAYMMQQVIEQQGGYRYLDSPPMTISAKASRPPYGTDGDYYCKPQPMDVFKVIIDMIEEAEPNNVY